MIHWQILGTATSRNIILFTTWLFISGIVLTNHTYLVKITLILCMLFLYRNISTYRNRLPVALTYQHQQWSFIYDNKICCYQISSGFAVWPLCVIEYFEENEPNIKHRLFLSYWDVVSTEYAGNWNQLGVVLNVSKHQNNQHKDILSLIS